MGSIEKQFGLREEAGPSREELADKVRFPEDFRSISETCETDAETVIEKTEKIPDKEVQVAGVLGRVRDLAMRTARIMTVVLAAEMGAGQSMPAERVGEPAKSGTVAADVLREDKAESKDVQRQKLVFGSPEYKQMIEEVRQKFAAKGITKRPDDADFYAILGEDFDLQSKLENAIENYKAGLEEDSIKKIEEAKKAGLMEEERWNGILSELKYPELLERSGAEFGVDPYKRIGYNRYKDFDNDILKITEEMNSRLASASKTGKAYPALNAGLLSAVVLQEGFAQIIEDSGYKSDLMIDSYRKIGLDTLKNDIPRLEKEGLLDSSYKGRLKPRHFVSLTGEVFGYGDSAKMKNEASLNVDLVFLSSKDALEGVAAILLEKRNYIIDQVGSSVWNSLNEDEQNYLTYAAYQWGQGNVVELVRDGVITARDKNGSNSKRSIPIANYPKYKAGKVSGRVSNLHEFIFKDSGRKYRAPLKDFHHMASQVAVSAKVSKAFFGAYKKS